ncbi:MAG: hypothetical protein WBP93_07770 [Pyrinomonadaceae bacterium]
MAIKKMFAGRTAPGATNWQQHTVPQGAFVDVDTSSAQFDPKSLPIYIISIGGDHNMFLTTGGCCIYDATYKGFRVYLKFTAPPPQDSLVAANLNSYNKWYVNWVGIEITAT